jgi:glycosyltransferase involved in cell wall biosynthesis
VIFLGARSDVSAIMNAADIFLFPSKYEGFGITLIEAQAVGLKVFSSRNVSLETGVSDLIEYLPIDNIDLWIEKIKNYNSVRKECVAYEIMSAEFSIDVQSQKYYDWLLKIVNPKYWENK